MAKHEPKRTFFVPSVGFAARWTNDGKRQRRLNSTSKQHTNYQWRKKKRPEELRCLGTRSTCHTFWITLNGTRREKERKKRKRADKLLLTNRHQKCTKQRNIREERKRKRMYDKNDEDRARQQHQGKNECMNEWKKTTKTNESIYFKAEHNAHTTKMNHHDNVIWIEINLLITRVYKFSKPLHCVDSKYSRNVTPQPHHRHAANSVRAAHSTVFCYCMTSTQACMHDQIKMSTNLIETKLLEMI